MAMTSGSPWAMGIVLLLGAGGYLLYWGYANPGSLSMAALLFGAILVALGVSVIILAARSWAASEEAENAPDVEEEEERESLAS